MNTQRVDTILIEMVDDILQVIDEFHVKSTDKFLHRAYDYKQSVHEDVIDVEHVCNTTAESICSQRALTHNTMIALAVKVGESIDKLSGDKQELFLRSLKIIKGVCSEFHFTEKTVQILQNIPLLVNDYYSARVGNNTGDVNVNAFVAWLPSVNLQFDRFETKARDINNAVRRHIPDEYLAVSNFFIPDVGEQAHSRNDQLRLMLLYMGSDFAEARRTHNYKQVLKSSLDITFKIFLSYLDTHHDDIVPGLHAQQVAEFTVMLKSFIDKLGEDNGFSMLRNIAKRGDDSLLYATILQEHIQDKNIDTEFIISSAQEKVKNKDYIKDNINHNIFVHRSLIDFKEKKLKFKFDCELTNLFLVNPENLTILSKNKKKLIPTGNGNYQYVLWIRSENESFLVKTTIQIRNENEMYIKNSTLRENLKFFKIDEIVQEEPAEGVLYAFPTNTRNRYMMNVVGRVDTVSELSITSNIRTELENYTCPENILSNNDFVLGLNNINTRSHILSIFDKQKRCEALTDIEENEAKSQETKDAINILKAFTTSKNFVDIVNFVATPTLRDILLPLLETTPFKGQLEVAAIMLFLVIENIYKRINKGAVLCTTLLQGVLMEIRDPLSKFNQSKSYAESTKYLLRAILGNMGTFSGKMFQTLNEILGKSWTNLVGPKLPYPKLSQQEIQAMLVSVVGHELKKETNDNTNMYKRVQKVFMKSGMHIRPVMLANASVGQVHILERIPTSSRTKIEQFYMLLGCEEKPTSKDHVKFKHKVQEYMKKTRRLCTTMSYTTDGDTKCLDDGFRTKIFKGTEQKDNNETTPIRPSSTHHAYELYNYWKDVNNDDVYNALDTGGYTKDEKKKYGYNEEERNVSSIDLYSDYQNALERKLSGNAYVSYSTNIRNGLSRIEKTDRFNDLNIVQQQQVDGNTQPFTPKETINGTGIYDERVHYCQVSNDKNDNAVDFEVYDKKIKMKEHIPNSQISAEKCSDKMNDYMKTFIDELSFIYNKKEQNRQGLNDFFMYVNSIVRNSITIGSQLPTVATLIENYIKDRSKLVVKFIKARTRIILCFEEAVVAGALKILYNNKDTLKQVMDIATTINNLSGDCSKGPSRLEDNEQCEAMCKSSGKRCKRKKIPDHEYCAMHLKMVRELHDDDLNYIYTHFVDQAGYIMYPRESLDLQERFRYYEIKSDQFKSGQKFNREYLKCAAPWFNTNGQSAQHTNLNIILKTIEELYNMASCKFKDIRPEFDLSEEFKLSVDAKQTYGNREFFVPSMYTPNHLISMFPTNTNPDYTHFSPVIIQDFVPGVEIETYKSYPQKGASIEEVTALSKGLVSFGTMFVEKLIIEGKCHGDPHPGNMKFSYDPSTNNGVIGILDFGDWIDLSTQHKTIVQSLGVCYAQSILHYNLKEMMSNLYKIIGISNTVSGENTNNNNKVTVSDIITRIMSMDASLVTKTAGKSVTAATFLIQCISSILCFILKKPFATVYVLVESAIESIGKAVVQSLKSITQPNVWDFVKTTGSLLGIAGIVPTMAAGVAGGAAGAALLTIGGAYFVYPGLKDVRERKEFAKHYAKKIYTLGDSIKNVTTNILLPMITYLLKEISPEFRNAETVVKAQMERINKYVTGTSISSIMNKHATDILHTNKVHSVSDNEIQTLRYFMEAYIGDEIQTRTYGNMTKDAELLKKFEALSILGPGDQDQCATLSTLIFKVGQAFLKYYNNFLVLEQMDNYNSSLGMSNIFQVLPLLLKLVSSEQLFDTPDKNMSTCQECAIEKEWESWKKDNFTLKEWADQNL